MYTSMLRERQSLQTKLGNLLEKCTAQAISAFISLKAGWKWGEGGREGSNGSNCCSINGRDQALLLREEMGRLRAGGRGNELHLALSFCKAGSSPIEKTNRMRHLIKWKCRLLDKESTLNDSMTDPCAMSKKTGIKLIFHHYPCQLFGHRTRVCRNCLFANLWW